MVFKSPLLFSQHSCIMLHVVQPGLSLIKVKHIHYLLAQHIVSGFSKTSPLATCILNQKSLLLYMKRLNKCVSYNIDYKYYVYIVLYIIVYYVHITQIRCASISYWLLIAKST